MAVAGAVALLLFGPDQLPKVARRAGQMIRDVQNTSQSFIREMERAADEPTVSAASYAGATEPAVPGPLAAGPAYHETPQPAPHELVAREAAMEPQPASAEALLETRGPAADAAGHPESQRAAGPPAP